MQDNTEKETARALKKIEERKAVLPSTVREETAILKRMKGGK